MRVAVPVLLCMTAAIFGAQAQTAPPRRITDVTAVLDQQKPDPSRAGKMKTDADAEPPSGANGQALADFLFLRAQARAGNGRLNEAITDVNRSIEIKRPGGGDVSREQFFLVRQYQLAGEPRKALQLVPQMIKEYDRPGQKGRLFGAYRRAVVLNLILGDVREAEANLKKALALADDSRGWRNVEQHRSSWAYLLEDSKARIFEAHGQFSQAEAAYHRSQELQRAALVKNPAVRDQAQLAIDYALAFEGRTKAKQGRLADAEADIRRALLSRLSVNGKFNPDTAQILNILASVLLEQARYGEAEQLAGTVVEIYQTLGYRDDSQTFIDAMLQHATTLNLLQRTTEATAIYDRVDAATRNWDPGRRLMATGGLARVSTLINTRNPAAAVDVAKGMFERSKARFGDRHPNTATAQGYYGVALARAGGHDSEALNELKAAMPALISASRENDDNDAVYFVQRDQRNRFVIETYMTLLARISRDKPQDVALETFQLADLIRGHAVQRALAASSARMAMRDQALAALVRQEQDLQRQIGAQLEVLNNALAMPPEQLEEKAVRDLQVSIDKLRTERVAARRNIERRFPAYASLVDPKPPTVDEIRAALGPDEALVSFYLGRLNSFVWVVPKQGPLAFNAIPVGANAIEGKVRELRKALEPEASTIDDIPQFDVRLANELYNLLLRPVEQVWKPAKHLIVVTNGALGLMPLSLLPTSPFELKANAEPLFANYREVPWLARTHAVTMIPSIAALRTLRQLPAPSAKRENFIGFGDPYFNAAQAAEGQSEEVVQVADATLRGLPFRRRSSPQTRGFDSAELGILPRLPDTATELKSIAVALEADPSKVLHLGIEANEQVVKTIDLSKYRIVVFATHGLVPGDLDGLTQPALALTAPSVAHVAGDGLLTMEEILALKLDADWVVLSACNTGAAADLGAEAVSGLGRAFFYAGTRAVLVTNWSVHSDSARELVSDLFRRQSADPKITRGEALRQAMVAMIDSKGYTDPAGNMLFSYAHPLFWAPYSIIGDGGRS